ncbi:hypothetical protein CR513_25770, partial [Mucuna pruriens]
MEGKRGEGISQGEMAGRVLGNEGGALFACHNINEGLKAKLVTLKSSAYALVWWYQVLYDIRRMKRPLCETWIDLKRESRERDLYVKLQRSHQGSKEESQEATISRFLHGLNREIQYIVELHHYSTLEDLVEFHLKRKLSSRKTYLTSSWSGKENERERLRKDKSPKEGSEVPQGRKNVSTPPTSSSSKSSSMNCCKCLGNDHIDFQCPNRMGIVDSIL